MPKFSIIIENKLLIFIMFQIERKYDYVSKFKIFDFWKKHFPQVGIWFNNSGKSNSSEPDLITIFQEEINPMQDSFADSLFINNRRVNIYNFIFS